MKSNLNFTRRPWVMILALALVTTVFASCLKNDNDYQDQPVAGLMVFNLSPSQNNIGFAIDGRSMLNFPVAYTNFSGAYLNIYPGSRRLDVFDANSNFVLATNNYTFGTGKYYSAFYVGTDSAHQTLITEDNLDSLPHLTGKAYVRYINAVVDSVRTPTVKISANGGDIFNGAAPYRTISEFKAVDAGSVNVGITNENSTVNANRTLTLEDSRVYTVLLLGRPGTSNLIDSTQIKFITNGTITP